MIVLSDDVDEVLYRVLALRNFPPHVAEVEDHVFRRSLEHELATGQYEEMAEKALDSR